MVDFTAARWSNKSSHRIFLHGKADMVQHFFVLIGKCNIVELYFRLSRLCL